MLSTQIYHDHRQNMTDREALTRHLLSLPGSLYSGAADAGLLCRCTAIHLYRKAVSHAPALGLTREQLVAVLKKLDELTAQKGGTRNG